MTCRQRITSNDISHTTIEICFKLETQDPRNPRHSREHSRERVETISTTHDVLDDSSLLVADTAIDLISVEQPTG